MTTVAPAILASFQAEGGRRLKGKMAKLPAESAFCKGLSQEAQLHYFCIHLTVHPTLQRKLENMVFSAGYTATFNNMEILLPRKKGKVLDASGIAERCVVENKLVNPLSRDGG